MKPSNLSLDIVLSHSMVLISDLPKCKDFGIPHDQALSEMQNWAMELGAEAPPQPRGRLLDMMRSGNRGRTFGRGDRQGERRGQRYGERHEGRYGERHVGRHEERGNRWQGRGRTNRQGRYEEDRSRDALSERGLTQKPWKNIDRSLGRSQFSKEFDRSWKESKKVRSGQLESRDNWRTPENDDPMKAWRIPQVNE